MTVGFHSPLPPARTGVADYSAALLAALSAHGDVSVSPRNADINLYHLGNNQLHRPIYEEALRKPGVVVLHDAVLQHFFLGSLDHQAYVEEFAFNYGEWTRGFADELWNGRASSLSARYFDHPMLRRIANASRAVVVHNPAAARMVLRHTPGARVYEVPLLFRRLEVPQAADVLRFRLACGIKPGEFVFGVFGFLRESKRLSAVLQVIRRMPRHVRLMIAGETVSTNLERALDLQMADRRVIRIPYLPGHRLWTAVLAADACINLRFPAAGETSDITVHAMGLGRPVIVSESLENSRFPETACARVEHGASECESLFSHMVLMVEVPSAARQIAQQGAAWVRERHSVERAAARYWEILCSHRS
jgi:glycosyltransferase involved in cell wall biosynthesis